MTRWTIVVSEETDRALRLFLAKAGKGKKGDLSIFVEEAVRAHINQLKIDQKPQKEQLEEPENSNN